MTPSPLRPDRAKQKFLINVLFGRVYSTPKVKERTLMLCYQGKEGVFGMKFKADITLKKWGSEETVANESFRDTCLKILKMDIFKQTSWHYHDQKESYFYIFSGEVSIHISDGDDLNLAHIELLKQGDCIFVGANQRHMITAMKESVLLESSSFDDQFDKTIVPH